MSRKLRRAALFVCLSLLLSPLASAGRFAMGYLYSPAALETTRGSLQEAALVAFSLDENGALVVEPALSRANVRALHDRGLRVVPLLSNGWDRDRAEAAVSRPKALAAELARAVADYDLDGVQLDLENLTPEHRDAHTELVRQVRRALPAEKTVAVAVPANPRGVTAGWQGSYDRAALAEIADYLMLMAYDEHYRGGEPGPVASRAFVEAGIRNALKDVPPEKLVLGIPLFGRMWSVEGGVFTGQGLGDRQIRELIDRYGGEVLRDESGSACAAITVEEERGDTVAGMPVTPGAYIIWFEDETAKKALLSLADRYGLKGAGAWRLGQEEDGLWDYFSLWLNALPFEDMQGHWAVQPVIDAAARGWVRGVSATAFEPDRSLTRAETAVLLCRVLKLPAASGGAAFTDTRGHWAEAEINAAAAHGLVAGVGGGRFDPDAPVTREQLAVLLYRASGKPGGGSAAALRTYADAASVSAYAREALAWAVSRGLLQGSHNRLTPQATATRAQAAAILVRWKS